ncbi:HD domain-containing protein [Kurthia zopfii]|uniref:HD domain-containing protein n=1 Tax=Kurthia zopfii TaxID=1650 RepID=UPI000F711630|nr:HD domain-containing protein [Kurthia zopfii]VEI05166.1 putative dGTPase [Kurthia zopfii]
MEYATQKLAEEKVFKDPVHRYIHVQDQLIWDLIATKEFQRLRRIKQLGTTYLVFHGAEHSRFSHSLGVYEIVRRMVDDVFVNRPEWDKSERLVALCAGLLHDLGHGPFSHAFEHVFDLDHEQFTRRIILGNTEVNEVLSRVSDQFPQKVSEVIAKTYPNKQVVSLISSQIDADRMDYLQRDAYFTGVSYGHFDMERILRVMRPQPDQIVIKSTGMHAIEDYIMSRYQMYWQVYFHPVSRSAEVILKKTLERAKFLYKDGYDFKISIDHFTSFFEGNVKLADYIALDESIIMAYFQFWTKEEDAILRDLSTRFLNRKLFKFTDVDPAKDWEKLVQLEKLFDEAGLDPNYYLVMDSSSDLPYDFYRPGEEGERVPIYLQLPNKDLSELSRSSDIVDAISGKRRTDHKLYYPKDLLDVNNPIHEKIIAILNA